jgi:hypothetical protein
MNAVLSYTLYPALWDLPENQVGEIIGGRVYTQPRPAGKHAAAASNLGFELGPPFSRGRGGPGGWWILEAFELQQGAWVLLGVFQNSDSARVAPFQALELRLSDLWS